MLCTHGYENIFGSDAIMVIFMLPSPPPPRREGEGRNQQFSPLSPWERGRG